MIALRHLREQVAVIVPDVRLLVGPRSCTCTSPFTSRQSCHVSSPYFKQLILGLWLWLDFCFTNFLDFNCDCDGYCDGPLSARARGFTFCMALRYFTLSSSLCAETIVGAWEVRLEKNMERVRAMLGISFYLYEVGSARAPKGFPWWTAGMKIDPRVPSTLIR